MFAGQKFIATEALMVDDEFESLERVKVVEALGIDLAVGKEDVGVRGAGPVVEGRPGRWVFETITYYPVLRVNTVDVGFVRFV